VKALIKTNAANWRATSDKSHNYLIENRGQWVEIDPAHLFTNQYNTLDGFRIFDKDIQAIEDDARLNKGKCKYCGTVTDFNLPCLKHAECVNYGNEDFNKCFFIQHPQGADEIIKTDVNDDKANNKRFYSFYSVNGLYYRISRRKSIEFVLVAGVPFIASLGYTHYKKAGLTDNETKILMYCVNLIKEQSAVIV